MRFTPISTTVMAAILLWAHSAMALMHTRTIDYKLDGKTFQGFLAWDDATTQKRPGVLLMHDWLGMGDYIKMRTKEVAAMGYVAFAADIYGKGIVAKDHQEAAKFAGAYINDRSLLRSRVNAGLDVLKSQAEVDSAKLAVMGYCFGGMAALELGRSGAQVAGIATFHGILATPTPADAAHIRGRVLVLHGDADPIVPPAQVQSFQEEMRAGKVDWQINTYGGAAHSFTVPTANNPNMGMVYHAKADRRSWQAFKEFLADIFAS